MTDPKVSGKSAEPVLRFNYEPYLDAIGDDKKYGNLMVLVGELISATGSVLDAHVTPLRKAYGSDPTTTRDLVHEIARRTNEGKGASYSDRNAQVRDALLQLKEGFVSRFSASGQSGQPGILDKENAEKLVQGVVHNALIGFDKDTREMEAREREESVSRRIRPRGTGGERSGPP
jgi:hypothetical protein